MHQGGDPDQQPLRVVAEGLRARQALREDGMHGSPITDTTTDAA